MDAYLNTTGPSPAPLPGLNDQLAWYCPQQSFLLAATGFVAVLVYVLHSIIIFSSSVKAPVVGYRHIFEPGWVVGVRFGRQAGPMIREGYSKVSRTIIEV